MFVGRRSSGLRKLKVVKGLGEVRFRHVSRTWYKAEAKGSRQHFTLTAGLTNVEELETN